MSLRLLLVAIPVAGLLVLLAVAGLAALSFERKVRRLREQGALPPAGHATMAHVEHFVARKEPMIAMRLWREIHGGTPQDAKRAVGELFLRQRRGQARLSGP